MSPTADLAVEDSLRALARTLAETDSGISPPVPDSIEDLGIAESVIEQLILKYLYFQGEMVGRDIARNLGLKYSMIAKVLETQKRQHQLPPTKSHGYRN